MKKLILPALLSLLAAQTALAECNYPARAKIADGASATKEEMIASQKSVKAYMAAMESYLTCIAEEEQSARDDLESTDDGQLEELEEALNKKHNAAVEEMEIVADEFNLQVRAYKARSE
ncbi:MAG: hypothetical protein AAGA33_04035 [Pseudomonadota bacterium]